MVRKVAIRGLTTHPNHVNPLCFQLISCGITVTCNRFVGFLPSWLFLIIWSKNVFVRQQRFFTATTKINVVSGKNQKPGRHRYIYIYIYWEFHHHPNWLPSFFRGVSSNHQPDNYGKSPFFIGKSQFVNNHNNHLSLWLIRIPTWSTTKLPGDRGGARTREGCQGISGGIWCPYG